MENKMFCTPKRKRSSQKEVKINDGSFNTIYSTPLGREMVNQTLSENRAEIKNYIKNCNEIRKLQNRRLSAYVTPTIQRWRLAREQISVLNLSDELRPFNRRLEYVVAYLDVWSLGFNYNSEVKNLMLAMGARIVHNFEVIVTHVVFQEGSVATYRKGIENFCHIVSFKWVISSKSSPKRVPELSYNPLGRSVSGTEILQICKDVGDSVKLTEHFNKEQKYVLPEEKNYKLVLVNGVVKKIKLDSTIIKNENKKIINSKSCCDANKTDTKIFEITPSKSTEITKYILQENCKVVEKSLTTMKLDLHSNCNNYTESKASVCYENMKYKTKNEVDVCSTSSEQNAMLCLSELNPNGNLLGKLDLIQPNQKYRQLYSPINKSQNWNHIQCDLSPYKLKKRKPNAISRNMLKCNLQGDPIILHTTLKNQSLIFSFDDKIYQVLKNVTTEFSGFMISTFDEATHLIVKSNRLTYDLLKGIARGCWLLPIEWLNKSTLEHRWLPFKDYDLSKHYPIVEVNRHQRLILGEQYPVKVFQDCGPIFLMNNDGENKDLQQIIQLCNGKVSNTLEDSWIAIEFCKECEIPCVSKRWISKCILTNTLVPIEKYLLKAA